MRGWNSFSTYATSVAIFLAFPVPCHTSVMVSNVLNASVNGLGIQRALRLKGFKIILTCKEREWQAPAAPKSSLSQSSAGGSNSFLSPNWRTHLSAEGSLWGVRGKGFMEDRWKFWTNKYFMLEDAQCVGNMSAWPLCHVILGQCLWSPRSQVRNHLKRKQWIELFGIRLLRFL